MLTKHTRYAYSIAIRSNEGGGDEGKYKRKRMPQLEPNYFINSVSWGILMIGVIYIIVSKYLLPIYVRTVLIRLTLMNGVRM